MNTPLKLTTFEEIHIAYEDMIVSDDDTKVDPVLMEGYVDNLVANSKALKAQIGAEEKQDGRNTMLLDMKTLAIFIGSVVATVFIGHSAVAICDWIISII